MELSFRARVLLLVIAVALTTAASTAWLTVWQATEQVQESQALAYQDLDRIANDITTFGLLHSNWDDVKSTVQDLSIATGQRVRIVELDGTTVADSTPSADSTSAQTIAIETRPSLRLSANPQDRRQEAATALLLYREEVKNALCLKRHGVMLEVTTRQNGLRGFDVVAGYATQNVCERVGPDWSGSESTVTQERLSDVCGMESETQCIQREIERILAQSTAPPAQLFIGSADQPKPTEIKLAPALAAAGLVSLIVLIASLLISRRVLRPIASLATVARQLGMGDLSKRVPERGRDELAQLTQSFNRMADSLQRSREQQHHMIGDIAHELRNPLANIRNYIEALDDGVFQPGSDTYHSMREEVMLQQRLVDDLQELALAESGSLVYHFSRVELTEAVSACKAAYLSASTARKVTIELNSDEEVFAKADPARLRQVVSNLISNSLRATPPGGLISLSVRSERGQGVIEIKDSGCGIEPQHVPHVFDRFWRADEARSRDTGGRGLGLAIARELITAQEGDIQVLHTSPEGTVFGIRLPLA
jgi:two-component system, OmpR family, sensor histidine kinase BaeS